MLLTFTLTVHDHALVICHLLSRRIVLLVARVTKVTHSGSQSDTLHSKREYILAFSSFTVSIDAILALGSGTRDKRTRTMPFLIKLL